MQDDGDDLSKPRIVDFCFVFLDRKQALEFAAIVNEREFEACISHYDEHEMWKAIVKHYMVPTHAAITALEVDLSRRAQSVGGEADGWGCMQIDKK